MKKLFVLTAALMLLSVVANAQVKNGDPGFYWGFESAAVNVIKGETFCDVLGPLNWGSAGYSTCVGTDTFFVGASDLLGWTLTGDLDLCFILPALNYAEVEVCITVPCDATVSQVNTLTAVMEYCDDAGNPVPGSGDCVDPNVYGGDNYYSTTSMTLTVIESPPALMILQDELYFVEQGASAAYVPFSICNGDACAPAMNYNYSITSLGHIGAPLSVIGSLTGIPGGECGDVYAILDAGASLVCDYDTLTIIAWDAETGTVYDTCVQIVHVIEPVPVPLFTTPVVTILVLAMILAAAVIMRKRMAGNAR